MAEDETGHVGQDSRIALRNHINPERRRFVQDRLPEELEWIVAKMRASAGEVV